MSIPVKSSIGTLVPIVAGWPGLPPTGQLICVFTVPYAISFPLNFAGSVGSFSANPTATAVYTVLKNGVSVGTASVAIGGTITFTCTAFTVAFGDRLTVTAPNPQDATLADGSITFVGTRI